ncbi:putative AMP binding domain protein [Aspergillus clavatus NRRL 1]|uniref:AMP binding domain protein, putative n=1 Tax=Aspergillus clavatus (strain ATCC 1007 / CBS 513.65 / DSM 816 / NCTC 3887 / NRRL 1 / QM 1276 / 107) TaxID=344612 RepID=A1CNV6_ASPCL|nr:AMP binding domain protein, putative [Aspergillus clavatus NRRL 1]EAW07327.1 AMP binding domain protein, putative [Aspergillus clavatus NRRL 1]
MAEDNPELQAALRDLDKELEEGDITEKGYQKRRTLLLSQYFGPNKPLEISITPEGAPASISSSNHVPPAILSVRPPTADSENRAASLHSFAQNSRPGNGGFGYDRRVSMGTQGSLQDDSAFQHNRESLALQPPDRMPSSTSYDSLFLPKPQVQPTAQEESRTATLLSQNYAFNPGVSEYHDEPVGNYDMTPGPVTRQSTMLDSQQAYFSDFAGQQRGDYRDSYGGGFHRYSQSDTFSPTANMAPPLLPASELPHGAAVNHLLPLEPRDIPFAVHDPHDKNTLMSNFENIPAVLRYRARTHPKQPAYWVLDQKGKEIASITWEKLASRAEKVAQVIRDKSNLYRGDRVALIYRDSEVIEFAVALMGCFIAGVVAVPINSLDDYQSLNLVLTSTQAHLALTTENNLKSFQRDITTQKLNWPRGVEWWKTNEFGSYHPKRKDDTPALVVPDLAYIEFSRAPTGDLRGVVMSHRTIMHQMACFSAIIATVPGSEKSVRPHGETLISYLDPRQGIGMILGVLLTVYGGHTTVWLEDRAVETPGLYAHLVTKYRATLMAANYPGLKITAYNYQQDPMATRHFKKNSEPNFENVKLCLIDTLTVDAEFHEILADRWLRPMRNPRAREIVAPMLCLPEHGGMVISVRDWLGGEERLGCPLTHEMDPEERLGDKKEEKRSEKSESNSGFGSSLLGGGAPAPAPKEQSKNELGEVLLDKEALKNNEVVVLAMGEDARKYAATIPNAVRVGSFGYPIPDATLSVVDPETNLLCTPNVVGEIWVDSPSLSGGFWALPKHTEAIFHARPYKFEEGNPTPLLVEPEFLRTGLLGCVIEGKVFVLGLYEDRLRQKVEWVEHGQEIVEHRYFFVQHLIVSILKTLPKIYDCTAFDVFVNDEHLPIVVLESYAASTAPTTSGGPPRQLDAVLLESLAERCMEVLYQEHHLRVYCVLLTAPNTLPRVIKNGRQEIGNMLCRKDFDAGALPCVHVKFGVERSVMNLPVGVDPVGGIWSPLASVTRQEMLAMQEKQYSGVDYREVVMDDRTSTPLNNFSTIVELLQWRVSRQAEELAYCSIDSRGKEGKGITWKKFDLKVAAVAMYLKNKVKVRPGDHLILMYTHSEDYVYAVHACFCLGVVVVPIAPIDQNRLAEDAPAFLHVINDFNVKAIIVNSDVDHVMRQKVVSQHIKQSAQVLKIGVPAIYNTTKLSKQSHGCRDLGFTVKEGWLQGDQPALIWTYWTPDQRRISVAIGHDTIMGMCKVQKETCQMTSSRPILGSVRSTLGLGFLHTLLMGIYVGAPTYLVSPVDFAQNPMTLFLTLSRYKIKDTYATSQMLDYAMSVMPAKGFRLQEMKNLMISADGRPRTDIYQKVRLHFATASLDRTAINVVYSHVLNPMVVTRSYMCIEPVELWLDLRSLRQGLVSPVDPDTDPGSLLVQDSGMVPVNTQVAIVNPETCVLSHVGEYGEIWIQSDACAKSFYGSRNEFDVERFNGRIADGDPNVAYVRTGDLGFLHTVTRPIGASGQAVEMQVLFVLGGIGETFEVNGLNHFPMDIENSVEKCHRNIVRGGCCVFQAGGLIVVVVEVTRKAYLASLVPVIVDAILGEHQVIADIVAFVSHGDFPRSRLGEKQRGKVLASWVTRKLRTIAQFSIRDVEGSMGLFAGAPQHRSSRGSKPGSTMGNSIRRSTLVPDAESVTVPRSPAPVLVEQPEAAMAPYYGVHEGEGPEIPRPVVSEGQQAIPLVAEAVPPTRSSNTGSRPATIDQPDLGFHFGEFPHSGSAATGGEPHIATAPPQGLPYRNAPRQGSMSARKPSAASSIPGRPISQDQGFHEENVGDWPQEALMYQSAFESDGPYGVHRTPSEAARNRYDGHEYKY